MAKKKPDKKVEPPKTESQKPKRLYLESFTEEQDMLTFIWLWNSLKHVQARCKDAIRGSKTIEEAAEKIHKIAAEETSPRASIYAQIIEHFDTKTDWIAIVNKMKEKMAVS